MSVAICAERDQIQCFAELDLGLQCFVSVADIFCCFKPKKGIRKEVQTMNVFILSLSYAFSLANGNFTATKFQENTHAKSQSGKCFLTLQTLSLYFPVLIIIINCKLQNRALTIVNHVFNHMLF